MAKGSDNDFPSILFTEQAVKPASPAAGKRRLYFKDDDKLYNVDEAGTETEIGAGGAAASFVTIAVAGQDDVVADSATDTLTLTAGSNVTITTDAGTDTITFSAAAGGGGDFLVVQVFS